MGVTRAILIALILLPSCNRSNDQGDPQRDSAGATPASISGPWGRDPAPVPANVDINQLRATPIGSGSDDESWIIHLTAMRWVDSKTQLGWFVSYKAKLPNDRELAEMNKYDAEHGRPSLDADGSAESFCRSRRGRLPTREELATALDYGLDGQLNMFRKMSGGTGLKESDGLWTGTPAPKGAPKAYCNPDDFIVVYDLRKREWNCTDSSSLSGGVIPQAVCVVTAN